MRLLLCVVVFGLCGCAAGTRVTAGGIGKGGVFIEPNFPRETINIRRVAVIPNRLPANLLDPEKWRVSNYQLVRKEFESRGFQVVDYATAVDAFERSGLPVEDTKMSREKFAEFAQALDVDAVVVPYYGTFSWTSTVFVVSTSHFATVSSFQVYLTERNDFLARIDTSAETGYTTGYGTLLGLGVLILGSLLPAIAPPMINTRTGAVTGGTGSAGTILMGVGGGLTLGDMLGGAIAAGKAPNGYWEEAFAESIKKGLAPFFDVIRPGAGGQRAAPPSVPPGYGAPPAYAPPPYAPAAPYAPPAAPYAPPAAPRAPLYPQPAYPPSYPPAAPQPPAGYPPAPGYPPAAQPPAGYPPVAPPATPPAAPPRSGCVSDQECKGGRLCVQGQCVSPPSTTCSTTADCPAGKVCLQGQCL